MWLLFGIAVALIYIVLTNKKSKKRRSEKVKKQEKPEGRQPIMPYRWSAESTEEQERELGMAFLSAEKQQESGFTPAASKAEPVVREDESPVTTASNDNHGFEQATEAVAVVEAEEVILEAVSELDGGASEAVDASANVDLAAEGIAGSSMIRSFWEAGRELLRLSGKEPQSFSTLAGGTRRYPYCQSALTDKPTARKWVDELQARFSEDLVAFIGTTRWQDDVARQDVEVVIGKSETPFDILRLAQTDAASYDLSTEDLINKLKDLDYRYGIRIYAAESDSIGFELQSVPENLQAFAAELQAFCPSAEGVGNPEQLASHLRVTRDIELRWI